MILLSQPTGNANVREAARALVEADRLAEFWTCVNWRAGGTLDRVLPGLLRYELARRSFPGIPKEQIHTVPLRELARCLAARIGLGRSAEAIAGELDLLAGDRALLSQIKAVATEIARRKSWENYRSRLFEILSAQEGPEAWPLPGAFAVKRW